MASKGLSNLFWEDLGRQSKYPNVEDQVLLDVIKNALVFRLSNYTDLIDTKTNKRIIERIEHRQRELEI